MFSLPELDQENWAVDEVCDLAVDLVLRGSWALASLSSYQGCAHKFVCPERQSGATRARPMNCQRRAGRVTCRFSQPNHARRTLGAGQRLAAPVQQHDRNVQLLPLPTLCEATAARERRAGHVHAGGGKPFNRWARKGWPRAPTTGVAGTSDSKSQMFTGRAGR